MCGIQEGQRDEREAFSNRLAEQTQGERVADPGRPLVDGVEGRRRDDERVGGWQDVGLVGVLVLAPNWVTGQPLQCFGIDELACLGGGDHADVPLPIQRQLHSDVHVARRRSRACDEIQDSHQYGASASSRRSSSRLTIGSVLSRRDDLRMPAMRWTVMPSDSASGSAGGRSATVRRGRERARAAVPAAGPGPAWDSAGPPAWTAAVAALCV